VSVDKAEGGRGSGRARSGAEENGAQRWADARERRRRAVVGNL
jgi:hypothetical protein